MIVVILLAGIVFYEAFFALKTLTNVETMQATMRGSLAVVQSATMSDEEKAEAMQKSSIAMIGSVAIVAGKISLAVIATAGFLFLVSLFRWSFEDLVAFSVKPLPLLSTIGVLVVYGMVRHGRKK
jgi:hypothetical protein